MDTLAVSPVFAAGSSTACALAPTTNADRINHVFNFIIFLLGVMKQ
jgi:hypothetical protein